MKAKPRRDGLSLLMRKILQERAGRRPLPVDGRAWGHAGVALVPSVLRNAWQGMPLPLGLFQDARLWLRTWEDLDGTAWNVLAESPREIERAIARAVAAQLPSAPGDPLWKR